MEERASILRTMKICRFCLDETGPLGSIYEKDTKEGKQAVPLPLQIMACIAIEVFANDGMPQLICRTCRYQTRQAYAFKTTCKKSDDALKLFLATGNLVKPNTNQEILIPERIETKKRHPETKVNNTRTKRQKTSDSTDVVTLNYSTPLEIKNSISLAAADSTESKKEEIESKQLIEMNEDTSSQEATEENPSEEQEYGGEEDDDEEDEDDEDEEGVINPILKVSQVKTDVFPCPHCERSFPLQQLLDLHMKNHGRERSFSCDECGRKFFTKYDLGKHIQTHSDLKPFTCVVCRKQFSRESLLHRHEKIHVDVPKYLCTSCDRTFLTRDDLDAHSEKHKKKRPFACRLCNKSFVFKQGLERHELSHLDEKPHKCNYCEASFTSPIKLTRHITSHAGLRPYPCKMCGRTFLLSHHLTRHMRSHYAAKSSNVAPVGQHKCDVCSMSFRRKDSLINHSAIHSMVNLKCVICNTAFDSAKMVKEHITTHLAGLPYPCDKCDYSFDTQDQLEEHELKHAEMEYEEQIEREVTEEAQQQHIDEGKEDDEYSDDDIAEYTITNPDNPEVVRRSKRETKIKNYAQFLKDELGSDLDDEVIDEGEEEEMNASMKSPSSEETIKPVVRSEGTKVYVRKNTMERPKCFPIMHPSQIDVAPLEQINQPQATTLENLGLTKQAVNALPNRTFVDMKIGNKTVRVQKLMMSKAEIDAMAKQGKIEMKGGTIILKNMPQRRNVAKEGEQKLPSKEISMESIIDNQPKSTFTPKPVVKKTYIRKTAASAIVEERTVTQGTTEENSDDIVTMEDQQVIHEEEIPVNTTLQLKVEVAEQNSN